MLEFAYQPGFYSFIISNSYFEIHDYFALRIALEQRNSCELIPFEEKLPGNSHGWLRVDRNTLLCICGGCSEDDRRFRLIKLEIPTFRQEVMGFYDLSVMQSSVGARVFLLQTRTDNQIQIVETIDITEGEQKEGPVPKFSQTKILVFALDTVTGACTLVAQGTVSNAHAPSALVYLNTTQFLASTSAGLEIFNFKDTDNSVDV